MPDGPKERIKRIQEVLQAWQTIAPQESFAGMTLAEFEQEVAESVDARQAIAELEAQLLNKMTERDNVDKKNLAKAELVVKGVVANPNYGDNSALYASMGYIRKSERKTGLTRKKKSKT